jgi:histidyl-tRNA synthetase
MAEARRLAQFLTDAAREHLATVTAVLDALGIAYERDDALVRGLDYYTHTVFEFTCDRLGAQSGIGGGGRYDGLVEQIGGPPAPGVGFGTGLERITLALGGAPERATPPDCYVVVPDADLRVELAPLVARLRAAGLRCETDLRGRSMKAMMRHANGIGARRVVIVGRREIDEGVATVREMSDGSERRVDLARLAEELA